MKDEEETGYLQCFKRLPGNEVVNNIVYGDFGLNNTLFRQVSDMYINLWATSSR